MKSSNTPGMAPACQFEASSENPEHDALTARLWLLRMMLSEGLGKETRRNYHNFPESVYDFLGVPETLFQTHGASESGASLVKALAKRLEETEAEIQKIGLSRRFLPVVEAMAMVFALDENERVALDFLLRAKQCETFARYTESLIRCHDFRAYAVVAACLRLSPAVLKPVFARNSRLLESGLVIGQFHVYATVFYSDIDVAAWLGNDPHQEQADPLFYFRNRIIPCSPATLNSGDFAYLAQDTEILAGYLRAAFAQNLLGVNVLIAGHPGTGKSEYIRMIAEMIDAPLYEIAREAPETGPLTGEQRIRAYSLSQALLRNRPRHFLLFDDADDVFRPRADDMYSRDQDSRKAWMNDLLETNPVPGIWIVNHPDWLDRAYRRRFDLVIQMQVPPRFGRSQVLARHLEGLPVSEVWRARAAKHEQLLPALVQRAARVARRVAPEGDERAAEDILERVLNNGLGILDYPQIPRRAARALPFRVDALNADCDLSGLVEQLRDGTECRACLYGAPGTGKSAFARYVAECLDRPLALRRTSDLLSPYIGVTEMKIREAFEEAAEKRAVLVIEEADSLLRNRVDARSSWETTMTNEMLTLLDEFDGVAFASTNRFEALDPAMMRRFDLKIRFDYLRDDQAQMLLRELAALLQLEVTTDAHLALSKLNRLAPGDFALIARQARLRPVRDIGDLVERLALECGMKRDGGVKTIGFANS